MGRFTKEAIQLGKIAGLKVIKEKARIRHEEYYKNPKLCEVCGKVITYEKRLKHRFCSVGCSNVINKAKHYIIEEKIKIPKEKFCLNCGKLLNKKTQSKYCNGDCSAEHRKKQIYNKYEELQKFPSQVAARVYLLWKNGNKCELCGNTEWQGQIIPLVMDHIDGNSDNHSFNNCRMICRNCDGLLPTYCGKNKINGSKSKRNKKKLERYHNGKSY